MYFMELANKLKARKKEYTCFIRRDKEIFAFSSKNPYFRGEKDFLTVSDVFEKERTKKIVPIKYRIQLKNFVQKAVGTDHAL